jgi:ornithine carbamoyltransferase
MTVPHLLSLAELSPSQVTRLLRHSHSLKVASLPWLNPVSNQAYAGKQAKQSKLILPSQSLFNKSIALVFSKRSTRTRVSAETAAILLGGRALFLGKEDIQLGVNENLRDTARVIGGMCQGIFARVGDHTEIEVLFLIQLLALTNILHKISRNWPNIHLSPYSMHYHPCGIPHRR